MRNWIGVLLAACVPVMASAAEGMIAQKSAHDVKTTIDRLERMLRDKGMTVFLRVDHAEGASKAGSTLRPTELLVFGNPKVGTPLMQCAQSAALDLPQKALAWEDESGQVWLGYNDVGYLAKRHQISGCDEVLTKISGALRNFTGAAAAP